jgi:hypothetical protein
MRCQPERRASRIGDEVVLPWPRSIRRNARRPHPAMHFAARSLYRGRPAHVCGLTDVPRAHELMEFNEARGKFAILI